MQKNQKPPRPPPLSVSHPTPPPPPAQPNPRPTPQPNPKPTSQPNPRPNSSSESPHSPLRSDSDDHDYSTAAATTTANGGAIVPETYYSPLASPALLALPSTTPENNLPSSSSSQPHQIISFNRREEPPPQSAVVLADGGERKGTTTTTTEKKRRGLGGLKGVTFGGVHDIVRNPTTKEVALEKINLGVRVFQIVFCLISFSVMASDRTQGWSGDSFDRYKEYRFCLSVNILGFLYAAFQAYDVGYHLVTGKHVITHHLLYQFDFIMDQILAYLLISASSAAASRVDDWQANWGKDEFTEKASASVSMAFLAFLGFAMSSLISGYNLCNRDLT